MSSLQSVLHYYGDEDTKEEEVAAKLGTDTSGTRYKRMQAYAESLGYTATVSTQMTLDALRRHIDAQRPVIVVMQAWADGPVDWANTWDNGHYVVVTGYDDANVYVMDPSTRGRYAFVPNGEFEARWHDADGDGELVHFGLVVTKDAPRFDFDRIPAMN